MSKKYLPYCDVFWPGSYPYTNAASACRLILKNENVLLHWPQLPKKSKKERMIEQTVSSFKNLDGSFKRGSASGFYKMLELLKKNRRGKEDFFKTQIAGPVTVFGKSFSKDSLLKKTDYWLKHAHFQIEAIQNADFHPIVVLDEPLLSGNQKILRYLKKIIKRLKKENAIAGIHCCNRISPTTLIQTDADLIHFDAVQFPSLIRSSFSDLQKFLRQEGIIAWGIVPTTFVSSDLMEDKIEQGFLSLLESLVSRDLSMKQILSQSMISTTCGTGMLKNEQSMAVFECVSRISKRIKKRYKLD